MRGSAARTCALAARGSGFTRVWLAGRRLVSLVSREYSLTGPASCQTSLVLAPLVSSSPAIVVPRHFSGAAPTSPRLRRISTSSRSPAQSVARGGAHLPTARGPVGVAFAQGPRGCLTVNVSLPGGVRARVLLPRWSDAATAVRVVDGAAAVSVI